MLLYGKLERLEKGAIKRGAERIYAELRYLCKASESADGRFDKDINAAIESLYAAFEENGVITADDAAAVEKSLLHLSPEVKKLTIVFAAHAHIDMDWLWAYDETVSITLSTFETMLTLLDEYPAFKFSQSQASVYRIVEKYRPDLLARIKKYVQEGRWEVTAAEWVEPDHNMISAESQVRHILYTKQYLSKLLDIKPEGLDLCFVPDTFGHNVNLPELLSGGGIKYFYFCRGFERGEVQTLRFRSPSGKSVLAYAEPLWYNGDVNAYDLGYFPAIAKRNGLTTALRVYGVGDHGGGATRKDIEKIIAFSSYPLFPTIKFGTFRDFFKTLDNKKNLPVVTHELNPVMSGCYTSQSCIKAGNKRSECLLRNTEAAEAVATALAGYQAKHNELFLSWENTLFNHFHDILPGSCVQDSRRYSMGLFQEINARAGTVLSGALRALTDKIDYSKYIETGAKETVSEGAGAGYQTRDGLIVNNCPARGDTRVFTVFNGTEAPRNAVVDLEIWDYAPDVGRLSVTDGEGKPLEYVVPPQPCGYFGHEVKRISVFASVPAFGYSTVVLTPGGNADSFQPYIEWGRIDDTREYVLENDLVRARLDRDTLSLVSLVDKATGKDVIGKGGAHFRFAKEDGSAGMSAWVTGRIIAATPLTSNVRVPYEGYKVNALSSSITYDVPFGERSSLRVTATLNQGSRAVVFAASVDFKEFGSSKDGVPVLEFSCGTDDCKEYAFDIPNGLIRRKPVRTASAGLSFGYAEGQGLQVISKDRYGYYADGETLRLILLRGSFDPDAMPEIGTHSITFAVAPSDGTHADLSTNAVTTLFPPLCVAVRPGKGTLPTSGSLLSVSKNVAVSALKAAEDGSGLVVRVYDLAAKDGTAELTFAMPVKKAYLCDSNENVLTELPVESDKISGPVMQFATVTVKIVLY